MSDIYLSVIVPCYNESANLLHGVLEEMAAYLASQSFSWEVLISDDGSSDNSRDIITQRISALPGFRLLVNPHGGKPSAVWHGIQAAAGKIVLFTDMDQSTPLNQFDRLKPLLDTGCDVVIGSRGNERENFPLYRRIGSAVFRTFRRLLILPHISDTQCGFKAFRAQVAREVFP
ncbi:MAG: glycosyltransferase, partial [Anaerolineae bacterium]